MKKSLLGLTLLVSMSSFASDQSGLPLNTEIEDILPLMSQYLESKLEVDKSYSLIKYRTSGNVYHNGVKQDNQIEVKVSKSDILNEINNELSYIGDRRFTNCKIKKSSLSEKITCTQYRPRYKQYRMEGQSYEGIGDAIFDISNSLYNTFTSDTREASKIVITLSKRTQNIKSVKIIF